MNRDLRFAATSIFTIGVEILHPSTALRTGFYSLVRAVFLWFLGWIFGQGIFSFKKELI
jgi:hypothetical protein